MKKLFSLFALTSLLFATSCSEDAIMEPANGNEATVTFSAELPNSISSRAYSDGSTAKHLDYAVYISGKDGDPQITGTAQFSGLKATVDLTLATGVSYDFIFWATDGNKAEAYKVDWAAKTMQVDYSKLKANDESNDAFYHFEKGLHVQGAINKPIQLYRPFAQINLGTDDFDKAKGAGLTVDRSSMVMTKVPNILNFVDGTVSGNATVTLAENAFATNETFPVAKYKYLEMNYVLAGAQKSADHTCTFSIYKKGATVALNPDIVVSNVPVQRNFRTNIYGSLLTDPATFNVEIIPDYETPDNNIPADVAAIYATAKNGGIITLENNVVLPEALKIGEGKNVVMNLNGQTLSCEWEAAEENPTLVDVPAGATLTVEGAGAMTSSVYVFRVMEGGKLYLNADADYYGYLTIAQSSGGEIYITDGNFKVKTNDKFDTRYMLNFVDSFYHAGKGKIEVSGGSFVGYDPAHSLGENPEANFVKEGYESVKRADADIYDVKIKTGGATATITTAAQLKEVLSAFAGPDSGNNTIIFEADVELAEGEVWEPFHIEGYKGAGTITIEGNSHYISGLTAPLFKSGFAGNSGVVINNLTIKNSVMTTTEGAAGVFFGGIDSMPLATFNNCHVENVQLSGPDWVGGIVGWATGYDKVNDGPVELNLTIKGCTVKNSTFTSTGDGSVGGLIGQCGANLNSIAKISDCHVSGCTFAQTGETRVDKAGWAIGSVNDGKDCSVYKVTGEANWFINNGVKEELEIKIGRFVANTTEALLDIDGTKHTGKTGMFYGFK